jgi:DNA polymerase elongation subunit (family B)
LRILAIDIETAPNTAHVWGLFKQNIGLNQILETGRVMCFSSKWLNEKGKLQFWSEHKDGHEDTIIAAHSVLDDADAVLSFNGQSFDMPTLNREFLKYDLPPPSPYRHIDLLQVAKRRFRFTSNKMAHLAEELGVTLKESNRGHQLWIDCMNGDKKAWKEMETYNKGDVTTLAELYEKMLPWIDTHPNHALYSVENPEDPTCTNCGSIDVHRHGVQRNKTHSYLRYQCNDCGTWLRGRFTVTKKNANVLVQIGG